MPDDDTTIIDDSKPTDDVVAADVPVDDPAPEGADDEPAAEADEGDGDDAPQTGAEPLSDEDREFLALKGQGYSAQQLVGYANVGWQAKHGKADDAKPDEKPSEGGEQDEKFMPVTREEMANVVAEQRKETRNTIAGVQIDATLDAYIENDPELRDDPKSRRMVKEDAWSKVKAGQRPADAFRQAAKDHHKWLAGRKQASNRRKIEATKARSSSGPAAATAAEPLKLEHNETDFEDGTALRQATNFMQNFEKQQNR